MRSLIAAVLSVALVAGCAGAAAGPGLVDIGAGLQGPAGLSATAGATPVPGQLGPTVGTSAIVAEWATGVVLRVSLTHDGTTDTGIAEPFLTGLGKPVPVAVGPDGSIFVGDWATGTVYRIRTSAAASLS